MKMQGNVVGVSKGWLWAEFIGFFVFIPVGVAVYLPPSRLFEALFFFMVVGLALLAITPGFRWRELVRGWRAIDWKVAGMLSVVTVVAAVIVMQASAPGRMFSLLIDRPEMMLTIAFFYPLLSALPQEVVFRALYFRRYGSILPDGHAGIVLNAAFFALAHLMYWSSVVVVMTFAGGLVFAWAHSVRRSFPMAWVLHSIAGLIVFAAGLGMYFYSGNVVRPF